MAARTKLQVPCAAAWLAAAAILLCVVTTAANQVATCQLELKGYGVGVKPGIKHGSLNCSTSDGSLLPVGLNSSYLGIQHLVLRGVAVKKDLPCMSGHTGLVNSPVAATAGTGILYFCGEHHLEFSSMIIHDLWTDQQSCVYGSDVTKNEKNDGFCCAMEFEGGSTVVNKGSIVKNSVGSVICTAAAKVDILDAQFGHNTGFRGAAVATSGGSNLTLRNCVFSHNTATSAGGAVYVSSSQCTVSNNKFASNSASSGGALALRNSMGSFNDNLLDGNRCTVSEQTERIETLIHQGGGLYADRTSQVEVHGCTFSNNQCQFIGEKGFLFPLRYYGGGMCVDSAATVTKTTFKNNDAMYGGGLAAVEPMPMSRPPLSHAFTLAIVQCEFQHNSVSLDGDGGGILISGAFNAAVVATKFSQNIGTYASALTAEGDDTRHDGSHVSVSNCSFSHNLAPEYAQSDEAPAVVLFSHITAHVVNSSFASNDNIGIGFAGDAARLYIINSSISNNTGSGIRAQGGELERPLVEVNGSLISNNRAKQGAGLLLRHVQVSVSLSTRVTGNRAAEAGGGVWLDDGIILHPSQLQLSVHDNLAPVAPDVFVAPTTLSANSNGTRQQGLVTS